MLVYDTDLRRPACVLIQAIAGGDRGTLMRLFDAETWLVNPTPGMKCIRGTREEWEKVARLSPAPAPSPERER